ncbi:hypothetical protein PLESTF_000530200 [Pleodorina starrii]|nr:hypothetical protein PLESTF_000530200 [Pleodorina starrii]
MGAASSCSGKFVDIVSEAEIQAAIKSIQQWEDTQKAGQRANQALRTVRKDSFKKAAGELNKKGGIVERLGGPDRVHDVIQVFYRKLFQHAEVRVFFENLPNDRMRAKQMKFMRYIMGGPGTYDGNLRCKHVQMVAERGLDLPKFNIVVGLLLQTLKELNAPQDVVADIVAHTEVAKTAIFTPNANELVTAEEMVAAAAELQNPLIMRLGGPQAVQLIVQAFYKKLFSSEELKYFFVSLSVERLRSMQFKFMRYLFCGAESYALTGGNMRCVHARMVKEDGLDLDKFNMVVGMLTDVLNDLVVSKKNVREIMTNVEAARDAIFTPGPDELVSKEELMAEASSLQGDLVDRLGGPEAVYNLISRFYARLFNDPQLKFFFLLSAERLRTKQFRFVRYLIGGPPAYAALGGNLRCKHLPLIRDKGLDTEKFDRAVQLLEDAIADMGGLPPDAEAEILGNVAAAKAAIFTPGPDELISRDELMAAADALKSDLVEKLGGPAHVFNVVASFYAKLFNDPELKYFFVSLSDRKLRGKQFKLMVYLFGGPSAYAAASPGGNLRCVHAKMVKENGLNVEKFDRVAKMMLESLEEEEASQEVIAGVLKNVDVARDAIFTPGADELVSKEEMVAEVAGLDQELVGRLGGPEAVYDLISKFYSLLFNDPEIKYFFTLTAERLRTKQFKFMRYLVGGPGTYTGDLRCVHAGMVSERGLDAAKFARAVGHLTTAMDELGVPAEVVSEIMANVEVARQAILGGAAGGGSRRPASAAARSAAAAAAATSLYARLGGDEVVGRLVDSFHSRLRSNPSLAHIYAGVDITAQRRRQLAFLRTAWGAAGSRPGSAASTSATAAAGGGGGGGGMTLGIAHAHLARDRALNAAQFEAIAEVWVECLAAQGAPPDALAEVRASLGPGKSLVYPPGPAAGCPFASSLGMDDESTLDAIIAAAAAAAAAEAAAPPGSSKPATPPAEAAAPAARLSRQASTTGGGAAAATAGRMSRQVSMSAAAAAAAPASPTGRQAGGSVSRNASGADRPASGGGDGPAAAAAAARPASATAPPRSASSRSAASKQSSLGLGLLAAEEEALLDTLMEPPPSEPAAASSSSSSANVQA